LRSAKSDSQKRLSVDQRLARDQKIAGSRSPGCEGKNLAKRGKGRVRGKKKGRSHWGTIVCSSKRITTDNECVSRKN